MFCGLILIDLQGTRISIPDSSRGRLGGRALGPSALSALYPRTNVSYQVFKNIGSLGGSTENVIIAGNSAGANIVRLNISTPISMVLIAVGCSSCSEGKTYRRNDVPWADSTQSDDMPL